MREEIRAAAPSSKEKSNFKVISCLILLLKMPKCAKEDGGCNCREDKVQETQTIELQTM